MTEQMIDADGLVLCAESFGDPADPPVLLVMGIGASMLWWDEGFCTLLAGGGRFVIRYDHRDTGRSATYEPGSPPYSGDDLANDVAGVLRAFGLPAAHIVGVSAGGAFAQALALDHPERVLSLVLISTTPAVPVDRDLPPPTPAFARFVTDAPAVDWSDPESIIDAQLAYCRVLHGDVRPFDEPATRALVTRDVRRANDPAAVQNHDLLTGGADVDRPPLSSIGVPTLVIHGTADPLFPLAHGEALVDEIPNATLLPLEGAGHGVDMVDCATIAAAILEHTAPPSI